MIYRGSQMSQAPNYYYHFMRNSTKFEVFCTKLYNILCINNTESYRCIEGLDSDVISTKLFKKYLCVRTYIKFGVCHTKLNEEIPKNIETYRHIDGLESHVTSS